MGGLAGGTVAFGPLTHSASSAAHAAPPPPPPTFVPTPIGPPPSPPTPVPTASAPTATPAATPQPTAVVYKVINFSLDAARVSTLHNPGNLKGLATVKRGSTVELMMYYTLHALPRKAMRITTYEVQYRGRTVYRVSYKGTESGKALGRFSRYALYKVPASLPYGKYIYRATLKLGNRSQTANWSFSVGKVTRPAR